MLLQLKRSRYFVEDCHRSTIARKVITSRLKGNQIVTTSGHHSPSMGLTTGKGNVSIKIL